MAAALTDRELNRATLARQCLLARAELSTVDAVEALCGMQAQEPKPPFIGLWARLSGFQRTDLRAALLDRTVVRGTLMRGTLHLTSARDYAAFRATFQPTLSGALRALGDRAAGLDLDLLLPVARALLAGGPYTFSRLREALQKEFPDVNERALGYAVRMHLPLLMVPVPAQRWAFPADAEFTLAETWLGEAPASGDAVETLALRYLAAFGPASVADMQAWSGLPTLKGVFERLRDRLVVFRDERRRELFDLPDAPRPDAGVPAPPRFLPEFDNLVLAHKDRSRFVDDAHRGLVTTKNLRVRATFLWDGRVRGAWSVERKRGKAVLRLTPFEPLLPGAVDDLAPEGEALLRFIEEDADSFHVELVRL